MTAPRTTAGRALLEPHGEGCRCWPHVGQRDAHEATVEAARLEYLSCRKAAAEPTALLRAVVEAIEHDTPSGICEWTDAEHLAVAAARKYLEGQR